MSRWVRQDTPAEREAYLADLRYELEFARLLAKEAHQTWCATVTAFGADSSDLAYSRVVVAHMAMLAGNRARDEAEHAADWEGIT